MKTAIISDTHDNLQATGDAVEIFNWEGASLIIHAGDRNTSFSLARLEAAKANITGVLGNVDGEGEYLKTKARSGEALIREERNVIWKLTDVRKITGFKNRTTTEG